MESREFTPKLAPAAKPHKFLRGSPFEFFLADAFSLQTLILGGALVQIVMYAFLGPFWAMVPAITMLLSSVLKTCLQLLNPYDNAFMTGVIPGRTTAQLPSISGRFGPDPGSQPVVVFNLGIQWNHPLGFLAPGVRDVSRNFLAMSQELLLRREELGLLSVSDWRGKERGSNNTFLISFYFKDVESIHTFAHEELHTMARNQYSAMKGTHIGVFHETFVVPARGYESMYVNCHPLLMGRGVVKCDEKKEGEDWVNTLVSADTPALKTQYARLGRFETGVVKEEYREETY